MDDQTLAGRWLAWVRSRWAEFLGLERRILDLQHRAAAAAYQALQRGDAEAHQEGKAAITRLGELGKLQVATADRMRELAAKVPGGSLGAFPVVPLAWAAAIVSAATAVAWVFGRVGAEERIVRLLEDGQLTAAEASDILGNIETPGPGQGLGDVVKWGALALIAWGVVNALPRRGGA